MSSRRDFIAVEWDPAVMPRKTTSPSPVDEPQLKYRSSPTTISAVASDAPAMSHEQVRNVQKSTSGPSGSNDGVKASQSLTRHRNRTEVLLLERRRILREQVLRQADEAREEREQKATDKPVTTIIMEPKSQEHLPSPPHKENENHMSFSTPALVTTKSSSEHVESPQEQTHRPTQQQETEQQVSALLTEPSQEYMPSPPPPPSTPRKHNVNQVSFSTPTLVSESPSHQIKLPSEQTHRPQTPMRLKEKKHQPIVQRLGTNEPLSPNRRHLSVEVRLGVSPPVTSCSASVVPAFTNLPRKNKESNHNRPIVKRNSRSRSPFRAMLSPMSHDNEIEIGTRLSARSRSPFAGRTYMAHPPSPMSLDSVDRCRSLFLPSPTTSLLDAKPHSGTGRSSFWERTYSPGSLTKDVEVAKTEGPLNYGRSSPLAKFSLSTTPSIETEIKAENTKPFPKSPERQELQLREELTCTSTAHPPKDELTPTTTKASSMITSLDNTASIAPCSASPVSSSSNSSPRSTQEVIEKIKARCASMASTAHSPKVELTQTTTTHSSTLTSLDNTAPITSCSTSPTPVTSPSSSHARSTQEVIEKIKARSSSIDDVKTTTTNASSILASLDTTSTTPWSTLPNPVSSPSNSFRGSTQQVIEKIKARSSSTHERLLASRQRFLETKHLPTTTIAETKVDTPRRQRSHSTDWRRRRENEELPSQLVEGNEQKQRQQRSKSAPRRLRSSVSPRVAETTAMLLSKGSESCSRKSLSDLAAEKERKQNLFEMSEGKDIQLEQIRQDDSLERKPANSTKKSGTGHESSKKWSPDECLSELGDMELNISTAQTDSTSESRSQEDEGILSIKDSSSESDACLGQNLLWKLDEVEEKIIASLKSSSPGIYRQRTKSPSPPTTVEVTALSSRDCYPQAPISMTSSRVESSFMAKQSQPKEGDFEFSTEAVQVWSTKTTTTELLPSSPSPFEIRHSLSEGSTLLTMTTTTRPTRTITPIQAATPSPSGFSTSEKLAASRSEAVTTTAKTPFTYQCMSVLPSQHPDHFGPHTGDSRNDRAISPSTISTLSNSCCSSASSHGIDRPYPLRRVIHTQTFQEKGDVLIAFSGTSNSSESSSTIRTSNHSGHPRQSAASFHSSRLQQIPLRRSSRLRQVSPSQVVVLKQREFSLHDICPSSILNTARFSPSLKENEQELPTSSCETTPPISGSKGDSSLGVETNVWPVSQTEEFQDDFEGDERKKEQYEERQSEIKDQRLPCLAHEATVHSIPNDISHDGDQDFSFDTIRKLSTQDNRTSSLVATTANENGSFNSSMQDNERPAKETNSTIDDEQPRCITTPNGESTIRSQYEFEDEKKEEHEASLQLVRFSPPPFDVNGLDPVLSSALANLKSTDNIEPGHIDDEDEEIAISWRFQEPYLPSILNEDSTSRYIISTLQPVSKLAPICYESEGKDEKKEELELSTRQFSPLQLFEEPRWTFSTIPPDDGTESKILWNSFQKTTKERNGVVKKIEHEDMPRLQRFSHTIGLVNETQPNVSKNPTVSMNTGRGPHTATSCNPGDTTSRAKSKLLSIVQAPRILKEEEAKLRKARVQARKLWEQEGRAQKGNGPAREH